MSLVETVTVRRDNVLLTIPVDQAERYLDTGYDIVDVSGKTIIEKSTPKDVVTLMKAYSEHEKEIAKLRNEVERLKDKLSETEAKAQKSKKTKN